MKVAVYATGPETVVTLPVVEWVRGKKKRTYNQGVVAFVELLGKKVPAKAIQGFAVIVPEEEASDPDVLRIAASAWRVSDDGGL